TGARYMSQFTISWKNLSRPARIGKAMNPAYRMWKACSAGRAETKEAREKREPASGAVSRARAMRALLSSGERKCAGEEHARPPTATQGFGASAVPGRRRGDARGSGAAGDGLLGEIGEFSRERLTHRGVLCL